MRPTPRSPSIASPKAAGGDRSPQGHRTLEVAVSYASTPQRVLHLGRPSSGSVRPTSVILLAAGILLLVGGAWAFGHQLYRVHKETQHRAKVVEFVRERGLPEKYAPQVTARPGVEAASAAAFVMGMFCLLFGGLCLRDERRRPLFRIGEDPTADYSVPSSGLPSPCFELVTSDGLGYRLHFTATMDGEATLPDGTVAALADLARNGLAPLDAKRGAWTWSLPEGSRCQVRYGAARFDLEPMPASQDLPTEPLPRRALASLGSPLAVSTLGAAAVLFAFLLLLERRPADSDNLEADSVSEARRRWVRELQANAPKEKAAPRPKEPRTATPPPRATPLKVASRQARVGHPADERLRVQAVGRGIPGEAPDRASSRAMGQNAGILSALRASSPRLSSLFARHAAMSQDAEDSLAAITGYTYGSGDPLSGIGEGGRGGGSGGVGGVSPCGAFCAFGNNPFGGFRPGGIAGGVPIGPGVPQRTAKEPQVFQPGRAEVHEGIDADTIQRIIRRQLGQIRYCYQAVGLPSNPRLQGEIRVAFLVGSAGRVLKAELASSTLRHSPTEQCVLGQVRTWRFPKTGGRTAYVVYPFRFRPAGSK